MCSSPLGSPDSTSEALRNWFQRIKMEGAWFKEKEGGGLEQRPHWRVFLHLILGSKSFFLHWVLFKDA